MSEEAELVDPQVVLKDKCRNDSHCQGLKAELQQCSDRVKSKKKTTETCVQEFTDFVHCADHCVSEFVQFVQASEVAADDASFSGYFGGIDVDIVDNLNSKSVI